MFNTHEKELLSLIFSYYFAFTYEIGTYCMKNFECDKNSLIFVIFNIEQRKTHCFTNGFRMDGYVMH